MILSVKFTVILHNNLIEITNMNRISITVLAALMLAVLSGCGKRETDSPLVTLNTSGVDIVYPASSEMTRVSDEVLKFTNRSTGEQITVNKGDDVTLLIGLYDCEYSAKAEVDGVESSIYGTANSIVVKNSLGFSLQNMLTVWLCVNLSSLPPSYARMIQTSGKRL